MISGTDFLTTELLFVHVTKNFLLREGIANFSKLNFIIGII